MTLLSHIFNEEYLLQWWVPHHKKIFDHAIIIDYGSTDRSLEIIRELAPEWEIRSSRNSDFDALNNNTEMMELESEVSGWKMILNTTEFLLAKDLKSKLGDKGIACKGTIMVDLEANLWQEPDPNESLVKQRPFGFYEPIGGWRGRARLLHPYATGNYIVGRHQYHVPFDISHDIFVLWYGWSPMTQSMLNRKIQIGPRRSERDKMLGHGGNHDTPQPQLIEDWKGQLGKTLDLRNDPLFRVAYEEL